MKKAARGPRRLSPVERGMAAHVSYFESRITRLQRYIQSVWEKARGSEAAIVRRGEPRRRGK